VDVERKLVKLADSEMAYDYLIIATGATHSYFNHPEWERNAPGLKGIEDALEIRRRVLLAFEAAERETDPEKQKAWLTFVVVGGGPTGVELAGALSEIARQTMIRDFRRINPSSARISGSGFAGSSPSGIVYAERSVWVANGGEATVSRFSPATFESGPVATPTVGRQPSAIAYGNGSIWVTNAGDGSVSRIDPSSTSSRTIPVGRRPSAIAVTPGAVWVANALAPECLRIAEGGTVLDRVMTSQPCFACALGGADGTVLFLLTAPGAGAAARRATRNGFSLRRAAARGQS